MTKTQNFNLNQWEPHDEIKVEDFNADNAAIDAALSELENGTPYVVGRYASTNDSAKDVTVNLGFQPSMVIIKKPDTTSNDYGAVCTRDISVVAYGKTVAGVTETGFTAGLAISGGSAKPPYTTSAGTYVYIEFQ